MTERIFMSPETRHFYINIYTATTKVGNCNIYLSASTCKAIACAAVDKWVIAIEGAPSFYSSYPFTKSSLLIAINSEGSVDGFL